MKNKKMIVVDLDGTLLNINSGCSKKSKKYLSKLKDMGYVIVIATGRVLSDAINVVDGASFANYVISDGGGIIYDMDNKKIVDIKKIDMDEVRRVFDIYSDDIDYITMCDMYYYNRYGDNNDRMDLFYDRKITDIDKFILDNEGILHIIVRFKDMGLIDKYCKILDSDRMDVLVMQDSFATSRWIEIFSEGVSKYNAIKIVSDIVGIDNKDIICFGDGRNDIDMIKNCGIGVAMGNALDVVKDVSDYVTISHNEDGIVYFLKGYFNGDIDRFVRR